MVHNFAFQSDGFMKMFSFVLTLSCYGVGMAMYVIRAVGMYSIAKRRQIRHAWFAWMPIVSQYLLGCISDQYCYVIKGENKSKRKALLVLTIFCTLVGVAVCAMAPFAFFASAAMATRGAGEAAMVNEVMKFVMVLGILLLVFLILALIRGIIRLVALYDLYRSCDPENAVIYLILSIFFGITVPFFLFFNRNKDLGMPPRRPAQPQYQPPQQPQYQPQYQPQHQPEQNPSGIWNDNC